MGLLSQGTPLPWSESRKYNEHVRDHGITQLLNCFKAAESRSNDPLLWGDEIEYHMIRIDDSSKKAQLSLDETEVLLNLAEDGKDRYKSVDKKVLFHPEYGRFMLEATPLNPYNGENLQDYLYVEKNMSVRRGVAHAEMSDKEVHPFTLTSFPTMGMGDFTYPSATPKGPSSESLFLPDEVINKHVRFPTLTANIRKRRGQKVAINIPLFKDTKTNMGFDSTIPKRNLFPSDNEAFVGAAKPGHIYMDSMGFGMGCCCLQVTFQAPNIDEARYVYDSFVNIAPALLSLTSATAILRGHLTDQDVRWNVISGAVDDRTPAERGVPALPGHDIRGGIADDVTIQHIPKSRYDSVDQYLGDIVHSDLDGVDGINEKGGPYTFFQSSYNDIEVPINTKVYKRLRANGIDHQLALHFAHLYIRDPLVIFKEKIDQDDTKETDHFENIQSTNWQTLRFKPPNQTAIPGNNSTPGWRVEIRPMEISVTDFENAAFAVFTILLARAIFKYRPNFYIPMSKVEHNMKVAHTKDSITDGKFIFRVNGWHDQTKKAQYESLSLDQLFNGCNSFEGFIPIVKKFVKETFPPGSEKLNIYFEFIGDRASGKIPSTASYIRKFVRSHPDYKHDSIVSDKINYDLIKHLQKLGHYDHKLLPEFFGDHISTWMIQHGY